MEKKRLNPPSDFLRVASSASLQSFELARLNRAANLRREIAALIDQWIEETSEALLARWMLEHHNGSLPPVRPPIDILHALQEPTPDPLPDAGEMLSPAPPRFVEALRSVNPIRKQKIS